MPLNKILVILALMSAKLGEMWCFPLETHVESVLNRNEGKS